MNNDIIESDAKMSDADVLFQPLKVRDLEIGGRIFKSASSECRANLDGRIEQEYLQFHEPLAWAGTPLIITGSLHVNLAGWGTHRNAGIEDDNKLPGLRDLTTMVHGYGSKIVAQLHHCGRQAITRHEFNTPTLGPSAGFEKTLFNKIRPMSVEQIRQTVSDFADAAERAVKAGFDGVQIHMGHGYLLNSFLTPYTNKRTDEYGGSFENRLRMPMEVLRAVRSRVGTDFPILIKINGADLLPSGGGLELSDVVAICKALVAEGVDAIEVSNGYYESGFTTVRGKFDGHFRVMTTYGSASLRPFWMRWSMRVTGKFVEAKARKEWFPVEGFNLEYSRQIKAAVDVPVITVGGFYSKQEMSQAVASGDTDAVSSARSMIADPFLVKHIREGEEGPVCNYCNRCLAAAVNLPVKCYNPELYQQRTEMLSAEGFTHEVDSPLAERFQQELLAKYKAGKAW